MFHAYEVLELGDPRLRVRCEPVSDVHDSRFKEQAKRLTSTLQVFRDTMGFGRAIAAPQIGILERFIAMDLGNGPFLVINPEWESLTTDKLTLWDDCMSIPGLLIKVARFRSLRVTFTNGSGARTTLDGLSFPDAELFQHEIDHLDGVLALDRALSGESIITRVAFERDSEYFAHQVDYCTIDTIKVDKPASSLA